jgi:NAD(P)H-flavin reductase
MSEAARTCAPALLPAAWTIRSRRDDTADTFTLVLERGGGAPFRFAPGQFNMLYAPGVGEMAISISGDPSDEATLTHTIRAVGAGTRALQRREAGMQLGLRGPFGTGWPMALAADRHVVLVAGGIGLAPLRPAILALAAAAEARAAAGLETAIYCGARTPADLLYADELAAWARLPRFSVRFTVDQAGADWRGSVGLVTGLMKALPGDPARTLAMSCGPEVMMRVVAARLVALGLDEASVYLSAERNMKCAVGSCGHCQYGPLFVCRDGPVLPYPRLAPLLRVREI